MDLRACLPVLALVALPVTAQGRLFEETPRLPPSLGVNVQLGFPLGVADRDLNDHVGWSIGLNYPWHLGGRHVLRPNLEFNRYRLTREGAPAWVADPDPGADLTSWKLGVDYLVYQEPWAHHGPYVFVGAGVQYARSVFSVPNADQTALVEHHATLRAPWVGGGLGYQFTPDIALELRYAASAYDAERGQRLASYTLTEPVRRHGSFVHLALAVRTAF